MSLSSLWATFNANVKLKPWLQFVGYMLAFGGLIGAALRHDLGFYVAFVGLGVSMAGFDYKKIYPS